MEQKIILCCFLFFVTFSQFSCHPISTGDENLKSIEISEVDLPTDAPGVVDKETFAEPEKSESFNELLEKYDELYTKNSTDAAKEDESPLHKRGSDDVEDEKVEGEGKSVIEKVENIVDPEVRKEFELELPNSGKIAEGEHKNDEESEKVEIKEVSVNVGTEYDPNYDAKIVKISEENVGTNTVEKLIEVLSRSEDSIFTTVPPSSPEIIEVVDEVVYHQPKTDAIDSAPIVSLLNVQADFEPIEIATKTPESYRSLDVEATTIVNDKFVGYQPNEDLVAAGEETTEPDNFFDKTDPKEEVSKKTAAEVIVDTLEFVGLYGKSLKDHEVVNKNETNEQEPVEKVSNATSASEVFETKTEIVEVNTEFSVSFKVDDSKKDSEASNSASEVSSQSTSAHKSSEESESVEKVTKVEANDSGSSEENNAKEKFDKVFEKVEMILPEVAAGVVKTAHQNQLMTELFKETVAHEVIKKDHPVKAPEEIAQRSFSEDKIVEVKAAPEETTTVGVYETFEDVVSTVSDGVKLTNEFRSMVDSFRDNAEENKSVLDSDSQAVPSKNLKTPLVNIAEEMKLEKREETSVVSYFAVSVIALVSMAVVASVFMVLKSNSSGSNLAVVFTK